MAIYIKDKKITPYRGDYKPVNIYQGVQKIAGWHNEERISDTAVEWDDTYNDYVGGMLGGRSEQVQTAQGKNHWRPNVTFPFNQSGYTVDYDSETQEYILNGESNAGANLIIYNGSWYNYKAGDKVSIRLELVSGTIVADETHSGGVFAGGYNDLDGVSSWVGGGAFVSNDSPVSTTTNTLTRDGMTFAMIWVYRNQKFINARIRVMHELSSASSPWEPFIPNSPSPDYPSPIISAQPVVQSRGRGGTQYPYRPSSTVAFPELRAIPLPADATEWTYIHDGVKYWADTATYVCEGWWDIVRRCGVRVLDGMGNWSRIFSVYDYGSYPVLSLRVYDNAFNSAVVLCKCTHLLGITARALISYHVTGVAMHGEGNYMFMRLDPAIYGRDMDSTNSQLITGFKSWLSAQHAAGTPVTVIYRFAEPTTERIHLGTLKSYPRYTHVEQIQDGVKALMELECKVINNI